jgi:hypothetical protein
MSGAPGFAFGCPRTAVSFSPELSVNVYAAGKLSNQDSFIV